MLPLATQELSAGQRTFVCIFVLTDEPKTLLLDESFAHLDLTTARRMTRVVQATTERVIFSTHQLNLLETLDEVIRWDEGALRMQGSPQAVLNSYRSEAEKRE